VYLRYGGRVDRPRWTSAVWCVALIIVALHQGTVLGAQQTTQPEELPSTERLLWRPSFALTSFGYDSNVLSEADNPKSDMVAAFGAGLRPIWQIGQVRVSGETGVAYNYFRTLASERGADATVRGRVDFQLSRAKLHVSESYINVKTRFDAEVDTRARRSQDGSEGGVDLAFTGRTTLTLAVQQNTTTFDDRTAVGAELGRTLDRRERLATTSLRYAVTPLTSFIASGEMGTHRFEGSPDRNGDRTSLEAGLTLSDDALIAGHGSVGWRRITVQNPQIPWFSGIAGSMDLSTRVGETTRVGVRGHRDVTFSFSEFRPYFVENGLGSSVTQMLGEHLEVGAHIERTWLNYVQPLTEPAGRTYQERIDLVGGSIGYRLPSGYRISVNIDSARRRTNGDLSRLYDSIRVYTAITPVLSF